MLSCSGLIGSSEVVGSLYSYFFYVLQMQSIKLFIEYKHFVL